MGKAGKQISNKSLEIIKLLESGLRQCEVKKRGYPLNTIRYYYRKLYKKRAFCHFVHKIQGYNLARYHRLDKKIKK